MARFIAIPVNTGDAFYLERKDFSVLVDGGMNSSSFAQLFERTVKKTRADIVVCTHNDADHANGIINFLESGYGCEEVWLPGRWADCIEGLMQPEREAISTIVEGAEEHWQSEEISDREVAPSFEEIGEKIAGKLSESENNESNSRNNNYIDNPKYLEKSPSNRTQEINEIVYDENNDWSLNGTLLIQNSTRYGSPLRRRISYGIWQGVNAVFWFDCSSS